MKANGISPGLNSKVKTGLNIKAIHAGPQS